MTSSALPVKIGKISVSVASFLQGPCDYVNLLSRAGIKMAPPQETYKQKENNSICHERNNKLG